jgi:hypothetical protein
VPQQDWWPVRCTGSFRCRPSILLLRYRVVNGWASVGAHLEIGIEREEVGIGDISAEVPAGIRSNVAKLAQRRREEWASWSTP